MIRFYLIRHGQKQNLNLNPPLTSHGIKQAQKTGIYLKSKSVDEIISSSILRAKQTAQIISNILEKDFETSSLLQERICWSDKFKDQNEFLNVWKKSSKNRHLKPIHGFSSFQSGKRLETLIQSKLNRKSHNIALITHGGIISDFLQNIFDHQTLLKLSPNFDFLFNSHIKECSITIVKYIENQFILEKLASVNHL